VKQKSIQTFVVEYAKAFGLKNLVIEQQYSMRSYETGLYDIRTDGNLKSILNILSEIPFGTFDKIFITTPMRNQMKESHDDITWLKEQIKHPGVVILDMHYAGNALENRKQAVLKSKINHMMDDLTITYFDVNKRNHTVFLCPGSPRPENPLYSMTEYDWFELQVHQSTATFFFNKNQDIYKQDKSKIFEISEVVKVNVPTEYTDVPEIRDIDIYFPYRLTDKDYNFEDLMLHETQNSIVGVTDPNNSLETLPYYDRIKHRVVKLDPKKHIDNLMAIKNHWRAKVYMPADLRKTVHMGPVETFMIFKEYNIHAKFLFPFSISTHDAMEIRSEAERCMIKESSK
jgi:hypothetical protein